MATAQQDNPFGDFKLEELDLTDKATRDYVQQYADMEDPATKEYFDSFAPATPEPAPTAGPSEPTEGPVPVSTPDAPAAPEAPVNPAAPGTNTEMTVGDGFDKQEAFTFLSDEDEATYTQMIQNPNVAAQDVAAWLTERGSGPGEGFEADLAAYREAIASGQDVGAPINYQTAETLAAEIVPQEVKSMAPTEEGWLPAMARAYEDAVQYGAAGIVGRTYHDWMGTGEDVLRQRFPQLNDDEIEALQEAVINQTQKGLRETNTRLAENDPMVPWLAGQFLGSAGVEDFIPAVRIAKGAKFANRLGTRMAEGAAVNTAGGLAYQAADVASGVQDEFSGMQALGDAALGAGFGGALELGGSLGRGILREDMSPRGQIEARTRNLPDMTTPRGKKGSKVFKEDMDGLLDQTAEYVNAVTQEWTNTPQINVNRNFTKLKGIDNDARGVFNRETGEVDLNMEVIANEAQRLDLPVEDVINSTLFHESLGHYGLLEEFGEGLDNKLADILASGDANIKNTVQKWLDDNPEAYKGAPNRDVLALEEVLAEWSESGPRVKGIYDTIANYVKDIGRKMGIDVNFSEREVKALLAQAHGKVIDGKGSGNRGSGFRLRKLWHGSGATFDKFDHSMMGTGEGNQVFGWGTYLTESRGIGEGYQRAIGGEDILWGGVNMPWYQMRDAMDTEIRGKYNSQMAVDVANAVFDHIRDSRRPPTPLTIANAMGLKPRSEQQIKDVYDAMSPIIKDVENRVQRRVRGRLYEVEVADDLDWNLWNSDLSSQPKMKEALEEQGFKFVSEEEYRNNQKRFQDARSDYEDATAQYELAESDAASPVDNPTFKEELLDRLFTDVQVTAQRFQEAKRVNENVIYDGLTGEDAYSLLTSKLGSDKAASLYLNEKGIAGNKYEAGTVAGTNPKNPDGSPVYNYVIFDDQTPKITARYSKPKKFKDPRDVAPVPKSNTVGQVARSEDPINTSELTADELMESQNADDMLREMTKDYVPTLITDEEVRWEAERRGFTYSDLMKRKGIGAGELSQRLMMYDIAMGKLNDKLTGLYAKIEDGTATATNRAEYLKTLNRVQELGARIFGEQSELGRALRQIQNMQYTLKNIEGLKELTGSTNPSSLEMLLADPEAFLRFARDVQGEITARTPEEPSKLATAAQNALNLPRAIMSSMDLSAPLRQGIFLMHKPEWWSALFSMFKYAMSQESYDGLMRDITSRPTYKDMVRANVPFTKMDGRLSQREEDFMSTWAEKIPGVKASERAYAGFLNKLRADSFDSIMRNYQKAGIDFAEDPKALKALGGFIGNATGRGSLGKNFNAATPWMSGLLFSPRLLASRVQMLNPVYYVRLPKGVREQAIMSLVALGSNAVTALSLASMMGADVEVDPRSSDFAKIKKGDTRYDILGGLGQYLVLGSRIAMNQELNSMGEEVNYGEGFKGKTRADAGETFVTNKFSPNASLVWAWMKGREATGDKFDPSYLPDLDSEKGLSENLVEVTEGLEKNSIASRFVPMFLQDLASMTAKYGPEGALMSAPGAFGVGVQDYKPFAIDPSRQLEAPATFERKKLDDGEYDGYSVDDGVVRLSEENIVKWQSLLDQYIEEDAEAITSDPLWDDLSEEEQADVLKDLRNQVREDARLDMLLELGID